MTKRASVTETSQIKAGLERGSALFWTAVIGATISFPLSLYAMLGNPPNLNAPQSEGRPTKQQSRASSQNNENGRRGNHSPSQTRPPGNGTGPSQGAPGRPSPAWRPAPPQHGGPWVKPGHPGFGPVHPPQTGHPGVPSPRPPSHHPQHHGPGRPGYVWGGGNGWRLHQFFLGDMRGMNRRHRQDFYPGTYLPRIYLGSIQPIPPDLMVYLPPVPPGYSVGYYDGYCLLYDPYTLRIVSVVDLYRY